MLYVQSLSMRTHHPLHKIPCKRAKEKIQPGYKTNKALKGTQKYAHLLYLVSLASHRTWHRKENYFCKIKTFL